MNIKYHKVYMVDDDSNSLYINKYFIQDAGISERDIMSFTDPQHGLDHIIGQSQSSDQNDDFYILFLDLNMPSMTGWQFLDSLESSVPPSYINRLRVCILTSSCNPRDRDKSGKHPLVSHYAEKPFSTEDMAAILKELTKDTHHSSS